MTDKPPNNPMTSAQRLARPELPRRFYKEASVERKGNEFAVTLDGRAVRTPAKRSLVVPTRTLAEALAAEWEAQTERIDPGTMPLTRIVNAAIDRVAEEMEAVRADIVSHAGSDLLCYRAEGPNTLVKAQDEAWAPILAWAQSALGARFVLAEGVMHVGQPEATLAAIQTAMADLSPIELAALHTATTLTGSAIIALALARGHLSADVAWRAAHADEDWQMSQWGADTMALERRAARRREMDAAALILEAARA